MTDQPGQFNQTPRRTIKNNTILLLGSLILTFILFRIFLHWAPETDLNIGSYNIHHLFTGLILTVIGGVPLAIFGGTTRNVGYAIVIFGVGLGMALDEWVYLIATDGSNKSYLSPVSFWGGVIVTGLACVYALGLAVHRRKRDREIGKNNS